MVDSIKSSQFVSIALRRRVQAFLDWWLRELAAVVPAGIRRWWRGTSGIVLLSLQGTRAIFSRPSENGAEEIFATDIGESGLAMPATAVRQRLTNAFGQGYQLFVSIPSDQVLQRIVSLPSAVAENLRQTLGFELDRYTPFRPDQAYFDYRLDDQVVGDKAGDAASLKIELAVVPRRVVDHTVAKLAGYGLNVSGVVPEEDFKAPSKHFRNLLPITSMAREPSVRMKQRLAFFAISAILLLVVLAIPIWQKHAAVIELQAPLAQAKAAAQETDALRDRLNKLVEEHDFLPNKKWDTPSATKMLEELTKLLADDTFVMQLDFDGKTVQVLGETGSASGMVETIEASPLFKDVAFKSPLTKIQGSPYDRFQIGATLEGMGKPATPAPSENAKTAVTTAPANPGPPAMPAPPGPAAGAAATTTPPNATAQQKQ
jgi:general secretion pathway protein L